MGVLHPLPATGFVANLLAVLCILLTSFDPIFSTLCIVTAVVFHCVPTSRETILARVTTRDAWVDVWLAAAVVRNAPISHCSALSMAQLMF